MPDATLPVIALVWSILSICILVVCGIWVFFSIRRSFTPVLVFDLVYLLMLEGLAVQAMLDPAGAALVPFYLITLVTFLVNTALTLVILYEWRDAPKRMNEHVWWLKIALAITGVYTIIPLGLYYLKLVYLPRHPLRKPRADDGPPEEGTVGISAVLAGRNLPPALAPPPELLDRYRSWEFLGQGGFARVFRVTKKDGAEVALKVPVEYDTRTGLTFSAEIQNWTRLSHENIVRVLEFNVLPVPFFEMELCGSSLARTKKPMDPVAATEVICDLCEGLKYCHARGIVHRDLKPSNILSCGGVYKISDWGLSKVLCESMAASSQVSFTPQYAAPEQILGGARDSRTDIWQAGVILFELLTGTLPFSGGNLVEVMAAITTRDPPAPGSLVPAAQPLDTVVLRCLERDPAGRYATVADLGAAAAAFLRDAYAQRLAAAIAARDLPAAELSCSRLLFLCLRGGDLPGAYRNASELMTYASRRRKGTIRSIADRIQEAMGAGNGSAAPELSGEVRALVRAMEEEQKDHED